MHIFSFKNRRVEVIPKRQYTIIFLGREAPDAETIDGAFNKWVEKNVTPEQTLILGSSNAMSSFYQQLQSNKGGAASVLPRLYKHGKVTFCGYTRSGQIIALNPFLDEHTDLTDLFNEAVNGYVAQQIEESDIVIPAPPGIYFDKLSSRYASHFIRAESLLQSTTYIELLALRLLKPFNDWLESSLAIRSGYAYIYIDTMGIWPITEKICQLHREDNEDPNFEYFIESFKSYDGLPRWEPKGRSSFILISATTSGGMEQKIRQKAGNRPEIWTLISLKANQQGASPDENRFVPNSLFHLERKLIGKPALDGLREEFETEIGSIPPGSETISVVGERFLSQQIRPKRVRLIHKVLEDKTKLDLEKLALSHSLKVGKGRFDGQSRWGISFDFNKLFGMITKEPSILKDWLKNYSSPSPIAVIYPSTEATAAKETADAIRRFADIIGDTLRPIYPGGEVTILSSDKLAKSSDPVIEKLRESSIIIAAPIIGNGFVFKQISALLRQVQPKGPRLFLAIAAFPETQANLKQLESDICMADSNRHYKFKYQYAIPIGKLDDAAQWNEELALLTALKDELEENDPVHVAIAKRIDLLAKSAEFSDDSVFLPSANGNPLQLSTGFFLWPNSQSISGPNYGAGVLLSAATLLQAARTHKSHENETTLRAGLFQHALICPDTFTRFNDSVIQAAILRAAYRPELNYSVNPEISKDMERLILKLLAFSDQPAGEAVGEFLLAIGVSKLRLRADHTENVLNKVAEIPGWIGKFAKVIRNHLN